MDIYAELSKKQLKELEDNNSVFVLPDGVELSRSKQSRACYFVCDNDSAAEELMSVLDEAGISWQEN